MYAVRIALNISKHPRLSCSISPGCFIIQVKLRL